MFAIWQPDIDRYYYLPQASPRVSETFNFPPAQFRNYDKSHRTKWRMRTQKEAGVRPEKLTYFPA